MTGAVEWFPCPPVKAKNKPKLEWLAVGGTKTIEDSANSVIFLMLSEATPTYERTDSPLSLDFPPPTSTTSFVIIRDVRDRDNAAKGGGT